LFELSKRLQYNTVYTTVSLWQSSRPTRVKWQAGTGIIIRETEINQDNEEGRTWK